MNIKIELNKYVVLTQTFLKYETLDILDLEETNKLLKQDEIIINKNLKIGIRV